MGQMRDSDWSRANLLRSDRLGPFVAICTTIIIIIIITIIIIIFIIIIIIIR